MTPTPATDPSLPEANFVKEVLEVFASVSKPLALAGLALGVLFLILRQLIRTNAFPKLTAKATAQFGTHVVDRLFTLAIVAAILGFAGFVLELVYRPADDKVPRVGGDLIYVGKVTDAVTGQPIEAAKISFPSHGEIPPQTTDSAGSFYLQLPPRPSFTAKATAEHSGYQPRTYWVSLEPGKTQSDDRFKLPPLATTSSPAPTATPPAALVVTPTAIPIPPQGIPAVKFHYRKWNGSEWFDGYFQRGAGSLEWREYNTLTADEFRFQELQGGPDFFTLYDASRAFYVRIPTNGGWVEGSIALTGPWGGFLTAERVAY